LKPSDLERLIYEVFQHCSSLVLRFPFDSGFSVWRLGFITSDSSLFRSISTVTIQHEVQQHPDRSDLSIELVVLGLGLIDFHDQPLWLDPTRSKVLKAPTDDKPVVKSFVAFIGDGYVASAFFAACAFLYFDPIANKNMAFAIVMCVLFLIITSYCH
jgi:hypothetical protein